MKFVSTPAESWNEPVYGGLFWINRIASIPPSYSMQGAGGQSVTIVPSLDLVVVRMGHNLGAQQATVSLTKAFETIVEAVKDIE